MTRKTMATENDEVCKSQRTHFTNITVFTLRYVVADFKLLIQYYPEATDKRLKGLQNIKQEW